jgi:hypothetical protein
MRRTIAEQIDGSRLVVTAVSMIVLAGSWILLFAWLQATIQAVLSPWGDTCCESGLPSKGTWVRAVSTFFAEYSLVSYVLATAIVISCLVLTTRRISFCGRAVTNLWAFVLANLVFLVIHVLLLLMVRPVGDFAGTAFSFLGTNYGGLSYGRILTGFIAEVVGIVALVGIYLVEPLPLRRSPVR